VEGGDVLERDEDVPVQLEVRHALDSAVGREGAVLIFAAEQLDLDLLTLVLVRVVLHSSERSGFLGFIPFVLAVQLAKCRPRGVWVVSRKRRHRRQLAVAGGLDQSIKSPYDGDANA
jgi:hypothetical protein